MGKQESPVELPPMYINHDEREAVTSLCARYGGYGGYTGYTGWEVAYRRECQLREALAQLRAANGRAERAKRERDACWGGAKLAFNSACETSAEWQARAEAAEAKLAVPPVPPPSLLEEAADLIRQYEDKRAGRSKFFPDFFAVTQWLARYKDAMPETAAVPDSPKEVV